MQVSTVCYIENSDQILMLYRNKKADDVNQGKWIGLGGKLEQDESPDECMLREVYEESGIQLEHYKTCGILTFIYAKKPAEYIFVYKASTSERQFTPTTEGELAWISKEDVMDLPLWEGDKKFLPLILGDEQADFFSLKLRYDANDQLIEAVLH